MPGSTKGRGKGNHLIEVERGHGCVKVIHMLRGLYWNTITLKLKTTKEVYKMDHIQTGNSKTKESLTLDYNLSLSRKFRV